MEKSIWYRNIRWIPHTKSSLNKRITTVDDVDERRDREREKYRERDTEKGSWVFRL